MLGVIVVAISRCFGGDDGSTSSSPYEPTTTLAPRVVATLHRYTQAPSLNCRAEPTAAARRVESLSEATYVGVVRSENGWSLLDRSEDCWVSNSFLDDSPPPVRSAAPARFYDGGGGGSGRRSSAPARMYGGSYANCAAARAAGADPVYAGEPGYGSHLDRDGDGVGCE